MPEHGAIDADGDGGGTVIVRRRDVLTLPVVGASGLAGCALEPVAAPPTDADSPTRADQSGRLDLAITNDDVRAHDADVEIRNGSGETVDERAISVPRGETRRVHSSGFRDARYTVQVIAVTRRAQYTWEVQPCPELTYDARITRDRTLEAEHRCPSVTPIRRSTAPSIRPARPDRSRCYFGG